MPQKSVFNKHEVFQAATTVLGKGSSIRGSIKLVGVVAKEYLHLIMCDFITKYFFLLFTLSGTFICQQLGKGQFYVYIEFSYALEGSFQPEA